MGNTLKSCFFVDLHDSGNRVIVGLSESLDSFVSGTVGMLHDHFDVIGGKTRLIKRCTIVLLSLSGGSGLSGTLSRGFSELLGLLHLHLTVQIFKFELTEDGVGRIEIENLRIVNDEDESISLLESDSGDASKRLHANLHEGLAALLLISVERVIMSVVMTMIFLKFGHVFFLGFFDLFLLFSHLLK